MAGVFSLLCPGLGQFYVGRALRGAWIFALWAALGIAALGLTLWITPPLFSAFTAGLAVAVLALVTQLGAALDAVLLARSVRPAPRGRFNRASFYIAAILIAQLGFWGLPQAVPRSAKTYDMAASSMAPSIRPEETIVAWHGYFDRHPPQRGDLAVFRLSGSDWIKRIIALPGDRIAVMDGTVHLNGEPLERESVGGREGEQGNRSGAVIEILPDGRRYETLQGANGDLAETVVPAGHIFVLGDNRGNSIDSRYPGMGPVPIQDLRHLPVFILFSEDDSRLGRLLR